MIFCFGNVCLLRLVVRTSGFHPDNMGSIPVGDAKPRDPLLFEVGLFCTSLFVLIQ